MRCCLSRRERFTLDLVVERRTAAADTREDDVLRDENENGPSIFRIESFAKTQRCVAKARTGSSDEVARGGMPSGTESP